MSPLLEVKNLHKHFRVASTGLGAQASSLLARLGISQVGTKLNGLRNTQERAILRAVNGVDLVVEAGETVGLVGESGSGKSTVARCILRLSEPTEGQIWFDGKDMVHLGRTELRLMRSRLQMVFQDPDSSLNPYLRVRTTIAEPLRNFRVCPSTKIAERVQNLLEAVELDPSYADRHPHQLSGGQKQRVAIARALAPDPSLVMLDEPTSSLDVTVQAEIVKLLDRLQCERQIAYVFISHDLDLVRTISDRVYVMYAGGILEAAPAGELFENPLHPYTRVLLSAILDPDPRRASQPMVWAGETPHTATDYRRCSFEPRCPSAAEGQEACAKPQLVEVLPGHFVACERHFGKDGPDAASVHDVR